MSQGRALSRTYFRKVKALAAEFNAEIIQKQMTITSDHYKSRFNYYNEKWGQFCQQNKRQAQLPDRTAFKKYIELCQ